MDDTDNVRIHSAIHSRYRLFDLSGKIPFSIVFGLCRRSPADTDPRPLVLNTAGSALDVPYALANHLLVLYEHDIASKKETPIDLSQLTDTIGDNQYLVLSSPVNRTRTTCRFEDFTTYQHQIEANSELASILKPGTTYTIRLASADLGVKWNGYRELSELVSNEGQPLRHGSPMTTLISKRSDGKATFKAASSLHWPPKVTTNMRLCSLPDEPETTLEIRITNTEDRPVSVQSCGRQRFLVPWGPFQPIEHAEDIRSQVIYPSIISNLEIVNADNGEVVRSPTKPPICGLYDTTLDKRPKLAAMIALMPNEPLVRRVEVTNLLSKLPDGKYEVRLHSRGAWWCMGTVEELTNESDCDRVPLYKTNIPPVRFETDDVVSLEVEGGRCIVPTPHVRTSILSHL